MTNNHEVKDIDHIIIPRNCVVLSDTVPESLYKDLQDTIWRSRYGKVNKVLNSLQADLELSVSTLQGLRPDLLSAVASKRNISPMVLDKLYSTRGSIEDKEAIIDTLQSSTVDVGDINNLVDIALQQAFTEPFGYADKVINETSLLLNKTSDEMAVLSSQLSEAVEDLNISFSMDSDVLLGGDTATIDAAALEINTMNSDLLTGVDNRYAYEVQDLTSYGIKLIGSVGSEALPVHIDAFTITDGINTVQPAILADNEIKFLDELFVGLPLTTDSFADNAITADNLAVNVITSSKLDDGIMSRTYSSNNGWLLSGSGESILNSTVIRGTVTANKLLGRCIPLNSVQVGGLSNAVSSSNTITLPQVAETVLASESVSAVVGSSTILVLVGLFHNESIPSTTNNNSIKHAATVSILDGGTSKVLGKLNVVAPNTEAGGYGSLGAYAVAEFVVRPNTNTVTITVSSGAGLEYIAPSGVQLDLSCIVLGG